MDLRREVYDHFHASTIRSDHFLGPANRDRFAQLGTGCAANAGHRRNPVDPPSPDFSTSTITAYIDIWGVVQAVVIQQNALLDLAASHGASKAALIRCAFAIDY